MGVSQATLINMFDRFVVGGQGATLVGYRDCRQNSESICSHWLLQHCSQVFDPRFDAELWHPLTTV